MNSSNNQNISVGLTNKVVNVTLIGGIIGLFVVSPQNSLNSRIRKENAQGWRVIQIIPAASGNIFLFALRLLILMITLFLYSPSDGYYIVMEKSDASKENIGDTKTDGSPKCQKCGNRFKEDDVFCENCGNKLK